MNIKYRVLKVAKRREKKRVLPPLVSQENQNRLKIEDMDYGCMELWSYEVIMHEEASSFIVNNFS